MQSSGQWPKPQNTRRAAPATDGKFKLGRLIGRSCPECPLHPGRFGPGSPTRTAGKQRNPKPQVSCHSPASKRRGGGAWTTGAATSCQSMPETNDIQNADRLYLFAAARSSRSRV